MSAGRVFTSSRWLPRFPTFPGDLPCGLRLNISVFQKGSAPEIAASGHKPVTEPWNGTRGCPWGSWNQTPHVRPPSTPGTTRRPSHQHACPSLLLPCVAATPPSGRPAVPARSPPTGHPTLPPHTVYATQDYAALLPPNPLSPRVPDPFLCPRCCHLNNSSRVTGRHDR